MTTPVVPLFVNGRPATTGRTFDVINPATEERAAMVASVDEACALRALDAAQAAFPAWSSTSLAERRRVILRYADLLERDRERLIDLLIAETGKPYDNAEYDFGMLVTCLRYFVAEAERVHQPVIADPDGQFLHYIVRQPIGVVVGLLAWNFPLLNLGYKVGPALAAGCTAVIKPSRQTPLATLAAAALASEAGIPAGVLNVIAGDDYSATEGLLTSPVPAMVTMIGSTAAGVDVMRTACTSVKRFSMELGGNAPVVVYPDADVADAAVKTVDLKFTNAGQVCVSPNRCFVQEAVYQEFLDAAVERARDITLGSGRGEGRLMGPLISAGALEQVVGRVEAAVTAGARLVCGGRRAEQRGYFMEPTILADVRPEMPTACDEIFGPVLPVIRTTDADDVLAMANATPYGLAAYVFTRDLATALRAADAIQAGSVCVNEPHYSVQLPHGGLKQSGVGKDCSPYSLEEYLTVKRVSIRK